MTNVRDLFTDNPVQMEQVIALLLQGTSVADISEALDIPRTRIARWYRESSEFKDRLAEVSQAIIDDIRANVVATEAEAIVNLLPKARENLVELLDSETESIRLRASDLVFKLAGHEKPVRGPRKETPLGERRPAAGD